MRAACAMAQRAETDPAAPSKMPTFSIDANPVVGVVTMPQFCRAADRLLTGRSVSSVGDKYGVRGRHSRDASNSWGASVRIAKSRERSRSSIRVAWGPPRSARRSSVLTMRGAGMSPTGRRRPRWHLSRCSIGGPPRQLQSPRRGHPPTESLPITSCSRDSACAQTVSSCRLS